MDNQHSSSEKYIFLRNENNELCRGTNGGFLIFNKENGTITEWSAKSILSSNADEDITEDNSLCSDSDVHVYHKNDHHSSSQANIDSDNKENIDHSLQSNLKNTTWNENSVKLLFSLYEKHLHLFKSTTIRNDKVWEKIQQEMTRTGKYNFTKIQIKDKWANMKKHYMRVKDNNKQSGAEKKGYKYYDEMDNLFAHKPNVNPVAVTSNLKNAIGNDSNSSLDNNTTNNEEHKRKKSKIETQLSHWTDSYMQHSNEKENRREQREKQKIAAIENATKTFRDVMEKVIQKL